MNRALRDFLVGLRHAVLEGVRSTWTWTMPAILVAMTSMLIAPHVYAADPPRAWDGLVSTAGLAGIVLLLWVSSGVFSAETRSGRVDLLISAGMGARPYAWSLIVPWFGYFVAVTWAVTGVFYALWCRALPLPGSVLLAIAAVPLAQGGACALGFLLGAFLPRRTNTLVLVLAMLLPGTIGMLEDGMGWGTHVGETLREMFDPAGRLHGAPGPDGVIFYEGAGLRALAAVALVAVLLVVAVEVFARPRWRERLR